ncbi:MAG: hypothetical protein PVJ61_04790 [Dehalococcoidia bacterium]
MKEEELIEKLKNAKLPDIELESHKSRLKMALLDAGYPQKQRGAAFWELAKSKLKGVQETMLRGLISRQPVWKTVTFGALAIAVVLGLSLTIPSLTADSAYAQAEEIAQNSPEVQAVLGEVGGEEIVIEVIDIEDSAGTVIVQGETSSVLAKIDLEAQAVTEVFNLVVDEQLAIEIAKADPRVQELLEAGATIGDLSTMYSCGMIGNVQTGETEYLTEILVMVEIKSGDTVYLAHIDFVKGELIRLIEIPPDASGAPVEPDSYSIPDKDPEFDTGETS